MSRATAALARRAPLFAALILSGGAAWGQTPEIVPPDTVVDSSPGTIGTPVYQKVWDQSAGSWWFGGSSALEIADDLHLAEAGDLVSFTFGLLTVTSASTYSARVRFYEDTGALIPGPLIASYDIPGLPSGVYWTQTIDLTTAVPLPQDIWMSVGPIDVNGSPGLDPGAPPAIGSSTDRMWTPMYGPMSLAGFNLHMTVRIGSIVGQVDHLGFGTPPAATEREGQTWTPFTVLLLGADGAVVETSTDPVTISLGQGSGTLAGTLARTPAHGVVTFDDISYDRTETISLDVSSGSLPGILGTQVIVLPFDSDLRVTANDITVTPFGPAVGTPTLIEATVVNAGSEPADAMVGFYLGDPDFGGTLIGHAPVQTLQVGDRVTFAMSWIPTLDGLQDIFVVVDNLSPPEATPADNRATRQASVGAAAEELRIAVGESTAWPGAQTSVPVTITNIGYGPATINAATFGPPAWLTPVTPLVGTTLQPGESLLALAELNVPLGTLGGPLNGAPVLHSIPIVLDTASGPFEAELVVKVFDQAASTVTVSVVDDAGGAPLANALVAAQALPGTFVTDGLGQATLQLPPGPNGLFAYRTGYAASAGSFDIQTGASNVEIRLVAGRTLSVDQVVSEPLSTQEILDRGIDPNVAANNEIFDFVVSLEIGPPIVLSSVPIPRNPQPGDIVEFHGVASRGGGGSGGGGSIGSAGGGGALVSGRFDYNQFGRTETWIIIPGEVWVLKQFFEVTTHVFNNANAVNPVDVQLRNVAADLNLPAGLALPDLDGVPQSALRSLPDLNAQEGAQAVWVIRGDLPGTYDLNGLVTADLFAFGADTLVDLSALAVSDPFDVTLPRVRCRFITPGAVLQGAPFDFGVLVTNEAAAPAQLVRVILDEADLINCTLVGTEGLQAPAVSFQRDANLDIVSATYTIGDLSEGSSGQATFKLISLVSGTVREVEVQNGCGGAPSPPVEVIPEPPTFVAHPQPVVACAGSVATFQVTADGFGPISYQWRKDGVDLPGATGVTLYLTAVTPSDVGSYDVVATNGGGATTSLAAILVVNVAPVITSSLGDVLKSVGESVVLTVGAVGDPLPTYQWQKDGVELPGEVGPSLSIAVVDASHHGLYTVVVSNACGSTQSSANLTVNLPPTIVCPGAMAAGNDPGACGAIVTYSPPQGSDDFPGATTSLIGGLGSGAFFPVGVTVEEYQVVDAYGLTANCSFTVTVADVESPILIGVPIDLVIECDLPLPPPAQPLGVDNCDAAPSVVMTESTVAGTCPQSQVVTRTWTVSDAVGNTSEGIQVISVVDTTAPVLTVPPIVSLSGGFGGATPAFIVSAQDNCDPNPSSSTDIPSGSLFTTGVTTVTATASDACGNVSYETFDVLVSCFGVNEMKIGTDELRRNGYEELELTSIHPVTGEELVSLFQPDEGQEQLPLSILVDDGVNGPVILDTSGFLVIEEDDVFGPYVVTDVDESHDDEEDEMGGELKIEGTFKAAVAPDFAVDDVLFVLDDGNGHSYPIYIPAGSFVLEDLDELEYKYEQQPGVGQPLEIEVEFELAECEFELEVKGLADLHLIVGLNMNVEIQVGPNAGMTAVLMEDKNNHLEYEAEVEYECCPECEGITLMEVSSDQGVLVFLPPMGASILDPLTYVDDNVNGPVMIDTECHEGSAIKEGDVFGAYTVTRLELIYGSGS